ncbi:MAG: hypothetical protein ACT4PE_06795 [Candidatus Eiseniibacteriota bacterium]
MARKVWSIPLPRTGARPDAGAPGEPRPRPQLVRSTPTPFPSPGRSRSGKELLAAYLLGPFVVSLWSPRRHRLSWAIAGAVSAVLGVVFLTRGASLGQWLTSIPYGVLCWLIVVPLVTLLVFTTWACAIGTACRLGRPRPPRWLGHRASVGVLGLLVPGLGLLIVGEHRRAVRAFWILGPMIASAAVLGHSQWLWDRSRIADAPGIGGPDLEVAFLMSATVLFVALFAWISQALDGMRRVAGEADVARPDASGAALLVSLVAFVAAFRPDAAARCLHHVAAPLEADGLRVIPLVLWETAARIDPVTPVYLTRAADLDEALGMSEAASSKRRALELRARQHLDAVGARAPQAPIAPPQSEWSQL